MTDCIPADAVRDLRKRLKGYLDLAPEFQGVIHELDSLIAQARPCDEGLREAAKLTLEQHPWHLYNHAPFGDGCLLGTDRCGQCELRTALAEEGK